MLIYCSDCSGQISTNATCCPHCGNTKIDANPYSHDNLAAGQRAMFEAKEKERNQGFWQDFKKMFRG